MPSIKTRIVIVIFLLLTTVSRAGSWPSVVPKGTTLYDPHAAYNGYILFNPMHAAVDGSLFSVHLINMSGQVVHQWKVPFLPLQGRLLPNGHIVVMGLSLDGATSDRPKLRRYNGIGGYADRLVEMDWQGKVVSEYTDIDMHHDFVRLPNGHTIYLAWEYVPEALRNKVRGGLKNTEFLGGGIPPELRMQYFKNKAYIRADVRIMLNDYLVEIDARGKRVWSWHASKHLDPNIDIIGPLYKREEWLHCNAVSILPNGNIVLTSRTTDSILIIDKKSGKIVSRWGNVAYLDDETRQVQYKAAWPSPLAEPVDDVLGGPHDADVIPPGYPGAGNLTIYNNGTYAGFSKVLELDMKQRRVVWQSRHARQGRRPFSPFIGSAQRLANGNTLICEGIDGRLFQVTRDNEIVWEYISPYDKSQVFGGAIYRARAYPPEYCPQFKSLPAAMGPAVEAPPSVPLNQLELVRASSQLIAEKSSATALEKAARRAAQRERLIIMMAVLSTLIAGAAAFYTGRNLRSKFPRK